MDLLGTLRAARARAAATPQDPAAWASLAEVLDVADRGALDADAGFQLGVDRWEALTRVAALAPTVDHLRAQVLCIAALAARARGRGFAEMAVAMAKEQAAAARVWQRLDPSPAAAAQLVQASQVVAEDALARGATAEAAVALVGMLEGLHVLGERTGKPEYALQIAGVHLHLAGVAGDPEAERACLLAAREVLDRLDAAGLRHPVQAQVREQVEARLQGGV
ncbi:MAG: hypothetical protein Q8P18_02075 [Pseudomonadota bacterium]|nr:hypothetical protein [Pseudomonadota bacterium]